MKTARGYLVAILCGVISAAIFEGIKYFGLTATIRNFALAWWPIWGGLALGLLYFIVSLLLGGRLQLQWGIYWDKGTNPYCPACKTPLTNTIYNAKLSCPKCHTLISLQDDSSRSIPVEEAKRILRGGQKIGARQQT